MKKLSLIFSLLLLSGLLFTLTSCEKETQEMTMEELMLKAGNDALTCQLQQTAPLTDAEKAELLFMKEEEKFARDVYTAFYAKWNEQVFSNIARAEEKHLQATLRLIDYYGLDNTVGEPGTYTVEEFNTLYKSLTEKGLQSLEEAYKAGLLIEENDIQDLTELITLSQNVNIDRVFENLLRGTRNHLRGFYNALTSINGTYTPQVLSQEEFNAVVTTPMEKGTMGQGGKDKGKGGGQGKGKGRWGK